MTNNNRTPGRVLVTMMISVCAFAGLSATAQEAPPQIAFLEAYQCSFNAGQGPDELMKARDYYVRQADKAGIEPPTAFLWMQAHGDRPTDFVWFNLHASLPALGASRDASGNAAEMSDVLPRFYEVADCSVVLATLQPQFSGSPANNDDTFVGSIGCNFKDGVGNQDQDDLLNHSKMVISNMENKPLSTWAISPFSGTQNADLYTISVFKNAEDWGKFVNEFVLSDGGQSYFRHRDQKADCSLSTWDSSIVVGSFEN